MTEFWRHNLITLYPLSFEPEPSYLSSYAQQPLKQPNSRQVTADKMNMLGSAVKKQFSCLCCVILLAGCASDQNVGLSEPFSHQYKPAPSLEKNSSIYATLERTQNGYEFRNFSLSPGNKKEPWVNLLQDTPLWNTETEKCLKGLAKAELKCSTGDEKLFRFDSTMTSQQAAAWGAMTVLSFGLWATMPPGQVQFDHKLYESAYADAYSNLEKQLKDSPKNFILEFSLNSKEILAKSAAAEISSRIINNTGFRFPYTSPSDLSISVTPSFKESFSNIHELTNYANLLSKINTEMNYLDKVFKVNCNKTTIRDFSVSQQCDRIEFNKQKGKLVANVTTEVLRKNRIRIAPSNLVARDNNFEVDITDREITIKNDSDKFLTVGAVSFYNGTGNIQTWSPSGSVVLPPKSIYQRSISTLIPSYEALIKTIHTSKSATEVIDLKYSVAASYVVEGREHNVSGNKSYKRLSDLKL